MKIITLIAMMALSTTICFAQDAKTKKVKNTDTKWSQYHKSISFSGGYCYPLFSFANSNNHGYAKSSSCYNGEFVMMVKPKMGLVINFGYYNNKFNASAFEDVLIQQSSWTNGWSVSANNYVTKTYLAGIYYTIPMKGFSLDFEGLIGVASCTYPSLTIDELNYATNNYTYMSSNESTTTTFAVGASIALVKPIGKKFTTILKADFYTASPKITVTVTSISSTGVFEQTISDDKKYTNLGLTFGIGYKI